MDIDLNGLKDSLTDDQVISLVMSLGADRHIRRDNYIIFPTICHNLDSSTASMKLFYYSNSKLFHCYTQCSDTFDIYGLIKRVLLLKKEDFNFKDVIDVVFNKSTFDITKSKDIYISEKDKYIKRETPKLEIINPIVLNSFDKVYPVEWLDDGISKGSMDKFNISFSISDNKIVIPHYDIDDNLIGIRARSLNEKDIKDYGKYAPLYFNNIVYKHPLGLNLYGLNISKNFIKKRQTVFVFEGEKSPLLYDTLFDENLAVATCGSSLNIYQMKILANNFCLKEVVLCYDKEYSKIATEKSTKYFKKLYQMCEKYKLYANFSFLFDRDNLLQEKDSPIDRGKEIFLKLYNNRVIVK